jgi:hypothetical protein
MTHLDDKSRDGKSRDGKSPEDVSQGHLARLIDAALMGRLTPAEQLELEAQLRGNDQAVRLFLDYCQLETSLHFSIRAALAGRRAISGLSALENQPVGEVLVPAELDVAGGGGSRPSHATRKNFSQTRWRTRSGWVATLAALLLVGLVGWWNGYWDDLSAERQPQPIARLTDSDQAKWLGDVGPTVGHRFVEGDSVYLTNGQAQISMSSGAEVVLRAPCFITLAAAERVELEEGVLTAQVAEWGQGFTVSTQAFSVEDLGTKFAVSASSSGISEAHVLDGQVRVQPLSATATNRRSVLLSSGEALRVESSDKLATRLRANRELYDADLADIPPFKPIEIFNTGMGLMPGDEDPHWRVIASPQCDLYDGPQFAVVCNADSRYLANEPDKSQWISLANPVRPGPPPNAVYTFETSFDLSGYNLQTVTMAAQVIADNGVRAARLNGQPIAFAPWTLNEPNQKFNRFVVIEIQEGFSSGVNTIEFDIWNGIDRYKENEPNPMSLRVEWQAFGRPLPTREIGLRDAAWLGNSRWLKTRDSGEQWEEAFPLATAIAATR